jgi:hypothetical protein
LCNAKSRLGLHAPELGALDSTADADQYGVPGQAGGVL